MTVLDMSLGNLLHTPGFWVAVWLSLSYFFGLFIAKRNANDMYRKQQRSYRSSKEPELFDGDSFIVLLGWLASPLVTPVYCAVYFIVYASLLFTRIVLGKKGETDA